MTTPLLDYDVSDSYKNNTELKISLSNFGIAPAKNVIISVDANKSSVEFLNFTTEPLLSKSDNNLTNQTGNAFFKVNAIPPTSGTIIKSHLKNIDNKTKITTSIRSDVWVGYHNLIPILILYPTVLIGLGIFLMITLKQLVRGV